MGVKKFGEETTKIGREVAFTVLGRSIADVAHDAVKVGKLAELARVRRKQEQQSADRSTKFAALARQIGDAREVGKDYSAIVEELRGLRAVELGAVSDAARNAALEESAAPPRSARINTR